MPYWGDKQAITFEAGSPTLLSDISIFRVVGQTAWISSLNKDHRFLTRVHAGGIFTDWI